MADYGISDEDRLSKVMDETARMTEKYARVNGMMKDIRLQLLHICNLFMTVDETLKNEPIYGKVDAIRDVVGPCPDAIAASEKGPSE